MVVERMNFFFAVKTFFYEKFGQKSGYILYLTNRFQVGNLESICFI